MRLRKKALFLPPELWKELADGVAQAAIVAGE